MVPYTLTDLILLGTHIITIAYIVPERENVLRKGGVPEEDGNRRECNDAGEAIAGHSTMNIDQSSHRHIPITDVTAMMIWQATIDLEHKGINLKPYTNLFPRNTACLKDSLIENYYY